MKRINAILLYKKYYMDKNDERLGQFAIIAEKYHVKSVLYPGSFIHITPSLVFPVVTYLDTDKRAKAFFNDPTIYDYISKHKVYENDPEISFYSGDYMKNVLEPRRDFDLLISQYAGFVSQYCKGYLKAGGLLLVNNSHSDASMASIDASYKLIGVLNRRGDKYTLSEENLDSFFIPKRAIRITKEYLEQTGRGIGYTKSPASYLFSKTK
jgi:hypothetical protein